MTTLSLDTYNGMPIIEQRACVHSSGHYFTRVETTKNHEFPHFGGTPNISRACTYKVFVTEVQGTALQPIHQPQEKLSSRHIFRIYVTYTTTFTGKWINQLAGSEEYCTTD